jgi:hypothetical protein
MSIPTTIKLTTRVKDEITLETVGKRHILLEVEPYCDDLAAVLLTVSEARVLIDQLNRLAAEVEGNEARVLIDQLNRLTAELEGEE